MTMKRFILASRLQALPPPLAGAGAGARHAEPPRVKWTSAARSASSIRRSSSAAFKIYRGGCANCHSMSMVAFRIWRTPVVPVLEAQAASVASSTRSRISTTRVNGRTRRPSGRLLPSPFANELAPRQPMAAWRRPTSRRWPRRGPTSAASLFIFDIFTQYQEQGRITSGAAAGLRRRPEGLRGSAGGNYNKYFSGTASLWPRRCRRSGDFDDGAPQTLDQYTKDVASFMMWPRAAHGCAQALVSRS